MKSLLFVKAFAGGTENGNVWIEMATEDNTKYRIAVYKNILPEVAYSLLEGASQLPVDPSPRTQAVNLQKAGFQVAIGLDMKPGLLLTIGTLSLAITAGEQELSALHAQIGQALDQMRTSH
jgi:hypothetical protein